MTNKILMILWAFIVPSALVSANDSIEIEMVNVEGGSFVMGFNDDEADHSFETPKHHVTVDDFKISKYEVTQKLWESVMGYNPSSQLGENLPVDNVTWFEVNDFIKKLNKKTGRHYRLPTEAEWEFAARGGNKSNDYVYIGGDDVDKVAWHFQNSDKAIHPVGMLSPNELGLYDMGGNVSEWVQDWYGRYTADAQENPKGPETSKMGKIIRGGNSNILSNYHRPASRSVSNPNFKTSALGFRLAE